MTSRGKSETEILEKNLFSQLDRLIDQLKDIEEAKDDMSTEEYADSKQETLDQLGELNQSLSKLKQGNLSLIDDVNRMQLAIQAAISNAFHTPDVIRMFAKKQQPLLRQRLVDIEAGVRQGKRDDIMLKLEILSALHKLGDALTDDEQQFVNVHSGMMSGAAFELASSTISSNVLNMAGSKIQQTK